MGVANAFVGGTGRQFHPAETSALETLLWRDKTAQSSLRSEETRRRFAMAGKQESCRRQWRVSKLLGAYSTALLNSDS